MKIGLVEQVRKADALSIQYGIDGIALMKNAARAVCDVILSKQTPSMDSICILCGNGNNAGDGFALATMLTAHFKNVSVLLLCGKAFSKDAAYYYDRLSSKVLVTDAWIESDVYVDAVFGTGFHGSLPS
ncbi:MAG: bifunctional ADP-dependent NAD(P)H-hydrate dehydratase/NAD(P)H-hydrate epimerase, partial [Clostridia bacterium]|nr:bifunctional ADP-dependent NAD(P)H-hydrate dehydratase/NAD(P)H-hydrate epimerase [Clostridia bacterium]